MTAAFLCEGTRTPFGRYGGAFASVRADDLAALPIKALLARHPGLDLAAIDEVVLGAANQSGEDNRNIGRMAALLAGLPPTVPGITVNRLCASGLDAIAHAGRAIAAGQAELMIAGGSESMTRAPYVMAKADAAFSRAQSLEDTMLGSRMINPAMRAAYGVDTMAETAENLVAEYGISRQDQDAFALRRQQRARAAMTSGALAAEITPVQVPVKGGSVEFAQDEHPRDTSLEALAKLKPIVRPDGTVSAGNASGLNDGAAAMFVASEAAAMRHGLTTRARILGYAVAGVEPRVMGIGPVPASRKLMARTGLSIGDFDVVELNEAFASQALAVLRELGLPDDAAQVNSAGGAIALGHPLGASGARLALAAVRQLEATGGKRALITLCVGVGQGAAMAIEQV